ncbi:MAG TPA: VOC family protein [Trebonia sp.]|nr:VOC family protein [Trebonia sp.]
MHASIVNITFDCADARAQALFWAAVTGWTAKERDATPGHVEYEVVPPVEGTPRLYFATVPSRRRRRTGFTWTCSRPATTRGERVLPGRRGAAVS